MKPLPSLYLAIYLGILVITSMNSHANNLASEAQYAVLTKEQHSERATASLDDIAWLAGRWQWTVVFDQPVTGETSVSSPQHAQMLGHASGWDKERIVFSEILTYTQRGNGVDFRVKHFSYDLHGWEPVDQPLVHPLIKVEGNAFYFDKHTIVRESDDRYTLYLLIITPEGQRQHYEITHTRVKGH